MPHLRAGNDMMILGPQYGWFDGPRGGICGHNPDPARSPVGDCGEHPVMHILLKHGEGFAAACVEHGSAALVSLAIADWHTWGPFCDTPGTAWYPSPNPDAASYCGHVSHQT